MRTNNRTRASAQNGDNGNSGIKPIASPQVSTDHPLGGLIARVPQPPMPAGSMTPAPTLPAPPPAQIPAQPPAQPQIQPPVAPPVTPDSSVPEAFGVGSAAADPTCPLPIPLPTDLTSDPQDFWRTAGNLQDLCPPSPLNTATALGRLGQPPFPRSGFPLMGFLATLFQHTSHYAGEVLKSPGGNPGNPGSTGNLPPDSPPGACETI